LFLKYLWSSTSLSLNMPSSGPNRPDSCISHITPGGRCDWGSGNSVVNHDRDIASEIEESLESRIFGGSDAQDVNYEADSESAWGLASSPSGTPPPLADHNVSSPGDRSDSTLESILPDHVRHLRIEMDDEASNVGVEYSVLDSSGSLVPTSVATSDDLEATETVRLRENYETELMFKWTLTDLIRQMMFVSGETAEPSIESTTLIEDITRQQVIEIVRLSFIVHMIHR
jgi:hypothetical protein